MYSSIWNVNYRVGTVNTNLILEIVEENYEL